MSDGTPGALSVYDVDPLRITLEQLVDFDLIKRREVRLSVAALNARTGNSTYFDNLQTRIGPEHVLAGGALPPAFAPSRSTASMIGMAVRWSKGMASLEQRLCIDDIKGFLSAVTIVIQRPGPWIHVGTGAARQAKVMAVLVGDPAASSSYADHLREWFEQNVACGGSVRVNPVIERGHVVDGAVPRSEDIVAAIAELWFNERSEMQKAMSTELFSSTTCALACATAMHVQEFRILEPRADATAY